MRDNLPKVPELEEDASRNAREWLRCALALLEAMAATHLQYKEFCEAANRPPPERKEERLRLLLHVAAKSKDAQDDVVEVKVEQGYAPTPLPRHDASLLGASAIGRKTTFFIDPLANPLVPEDSTARRLRMTVWEALRKSLTKHTDLVVQQKEGDVASLIALVAAIPKTLGVRGLLEDVRTMTKLKKTPNKRWADLVKEIKLLQESFSSVEDEGMRVGDRMLAEFVMQDLESDPDYAVEVSMLRKERGGIQLDRIIADIGRRALSVEAGKATLTLSGLQAKVEANARKPGRSAVCFKFRDSGTCRFGDTCRFSHDTRSRGACYVCGDTGHGVNARGECPERTTVPKADAEGLEAALALRDPDPYECYAVDPELATAMAARRRGGD
jgi:hypothetical protein